MSWVINKIIGNYLQFLWIIITVDLFIDFSSPNLGNRTVYNNDVNILIH